MKLRHKDKVKLAKKHMSTEEIRHRVPIFLSWWWDNRRKTIANNLKKKYNEKTEKHNK